MTTLVKTFAAAALIAVSTFAMAAEGPSTKSVKANVNLSTADFALEHYIAVTTAGESAGVEQLFTGDFSHKANATTHHRDAVVKFFKKQKGEKLNCEVSTDIIEEAADFMVAKVTMKFENFTKTDLVTLVREDDSWKVSRSINAYR